VRFSETVKLGELFEIRIGETKVRTKLQEILSDSEFTVLQPTQKGIPVRAGDQDVTFTFYRANGCFSFGARMLGTYKNGDVNLCRVERVSEMERIQRRQCYRLPVVLDMTVCTEEDDNPRKYRGKTVNLSEKSVEFSCFSGFYENEELTVEIALSEAEAYASKAKVLRCAHPLSGSDPYVTVLAFTGQSEKDRRLLRRYIFRRQMATRKKL